MTVMLRRILEVSKGYKGRIYGAMGFSFLKGLLMKVPVIVTYFVVTAYLDGTVSGRTALYGGIALTASVVLQAIFQYLADRLQSAAGYMIFADMRMKLGEHLRRLPMGYFTEGNIGRISSVLSTDMVFIEENCMMVLADVMCYLFSQCIMILFMFLFDWRLGLASLAVTGCMILLGRGMVKSDLSHSKDRQDASEIQTKAVLDFTEGIGIIKTYNLLGEKSKELTDRFDTNCRVNLDFEFSHHPYKRGVFLIYGIGTVLMLTLSAVLYTKGLMELKYFLGMLLCLFDLFVPIKSFYDQEARLTVMSACMDRIEALFAEKELDDSGRQTLDKTSAP